MDVGPFRDFIMATHLNSELVESTEDVFRRYLRERGLKYTPERRTLLREILKQDEHFEAEQLLIILRQAGKRVAKATIYRTLPLLVDSGILQQVHFGDNLARYENTFRQGPHDHMVCRRCRRVIEFSSEEVLRVRDEVAERHGFRALAHRFQISGLCTDCYAKASQENGNDP